MNFPRTLITALLLGLSASLSAQDLLTTIGTTVTVAGQPQAYLIWQPQSTTATLVRRIGIYSKPGAADSNGVFVREGIQTLQSSPRTIRAMLELGSKLDRDPRGAATRIDGMYRDITLRQGQAPANPADPNFDAAEKLAFIIQSAARAPTDPKLLARLFFLGRAHAGVMLALGHAFTKPLIGLRTYEVRELDDADADLRVLGRVTLDPAAPLVLPPPDPPVAVPNPVKAGSQFRVSSMDHLNVRLRWSMPPLLKQRLAHTFGFDVFRVKKTVAETLGWHLDPPTATDMLNLLAAVNPADTNPDLALANELPIISTQQLTPDQAALNKPTSADLSIVFIADDGVRHTVADGSRALRPYTDGEAFYYFVAARSIAGQPGQLSRGTLVTICDRLPPNPPTIESVLSTFVAPKEKAEIVNQGGSQFLRLKFRQLPDTDEEGATKYFIYRWDNPQEYLSHLGDLPELNRIGVVNQRAGDKFAFFDDNRNDAPTIKNHLDKSVWYTMRAVGRTACGDEKTLSGHSAPVAGVLRDFKAPDAPTGFFKITSHIPSVTPGDVLRPKIGPEADKLRNDKGVPSNFNGITIRAERADANISAAIIELAQRQPDGSFLVLYGKQHLYKTGDILRVSLPYEEPTDVAKRLRISVRAISASGLISAPENLETSDKSNTDYVVFTFSLKTTKKTIVAAEDQSVHESANPDGKVNTITGELFYEPQENIREWRVYRRIGTDGELSLIAKGEGDPTEKGGKFEISDAKWEDTAMPSAPGTRICYYGQILDQNANASPLALLGCTQIVSPHLPTPMLTQPKTVVKKGDKPELQLEWFCDPVGVERFEVLIAQPDGTIPSITGLTHVSGIGTLESSLDRLEFTELPGLSFSGFQTSRVGAGLGSGPRFTVTISVTQTEPSPLHIAVRAVGPGTFPRAAGSASNVVVTALQTTVSPAAAGDFIPWPARPLPPVYVNDLDNNAYAIGEGPFTTVNGAAFGASTAILVGLTRQAIKNTPGTSTELDASIRDPRQLLFKLRTVKDDPSITEALMPFMIYRHQLPSAEFPNARPNLVQCSPLLDRISSVEEGGARAVRDPYFSFIAIPTGGLAILSPSQQAAVAASSGGQQAAAATTKPPEPPYLEGATGVIVAKDLLPVIEGAKYQHLIVRFDDRGEVKQVIPLQPIQH
jgi:hypothetical protein